MPTNTKYFIEFSKPFIAAAKNVFNTMVFTEISTENPYIKKEHKSIGDISSILGVSGKIKRDGKEFDYKAMLVLSWPYDTYFKIASAMLMETYTSYSDEIADVGGELANMIMGNAKRDLTGMGYTTNMAVPSSINGPGHSINYIAKTDIIVIPIICNHGKMIMEICYLEESL